MLYVALADGRRLPANVEVAKEEVAETDNVPPNMALPEP